MRYFYISNDQLVGEQYDDTGLPAGYSIVEADTLLPLSELYYDLEKLAVLPIPEKPGDDYFWTGSSWLSYTPQAPATPDASKDEIALAAQAHISKIDPVLAHAFTYVVGRLNNDAVLTHTSLENLRKILKPEKPIPVVWETPTD